VQTSQLPCPAGTKVGHSLSMPATHEKLELAQATEALQLPLLVVHDQSNPHHDELLKPLELLAPLFKQASQVMLAPSFTIGLMAHTTANIAKINVTRNRARMLLMYPLRIRVRSWEILLLREERFAVYWTNMVGRNQGEK
jgi:hypothetical protein